MGTQLAEFYNKAEKLGALKAKMRLAMITGIPSAKAGEAPDSPETLSKFQDAMEKLQAEFN